ncbi:hypothetical protein Halru_0546 [Halovivax ruber XH-70]|uniref:DUF7344 domain-containing protein n=1 Tax=Halovivax ruber (strain DSM 18193 / JCM 13892 / XH-70) TaxID=797302 RepID=L0I8Z4_HALRX|nr:hypothetical protein [Halovivax ruber]AGB15179.1 hypothetical protein Halru_0546 [Halovivax ruber XH-70]
MGGTIHETVDRSGSSPSESRRLTEDELFELLANGRRRHILNALLREGTTLDIGTISQEIAAQEDGLAFEEVSSKDRKRVYTALQQSHLPKLDRSGVVDFDRDRGTVEPTAALENVEIYMDVVRGRELPWSDYYLGLAALSVLVLVASSVSVVPFTVLPARAVTVFVVVSFSVFALAHRYVARRSRLGIDEDRLDVEFDYREHR